MSLLPDAEAFRRLVDGSHRGVAAAVARAALGVLELQYAAAMHRRAVQATSGVLPVPPSVRLPTEITGTCAGSAGKTPRS